MPRMRFPSLALASLSLVLASAGCSSSSSGPGATTGADPIAPTSTTPADASYFAQANNQSETLVNAYFQLTTAGGTPCTSEVVAGCTITTCTKSGTTATTVNLDPGALSVTSASLGTGTPVALTGGYGRIVKEVPFPAGELVELKGAGGADFPAFDVTATIPPVLSGLGFDGCTSTSADAPCVLSASGSVASWTGATGATVGLSLSPTLDTATQLSLSCRWDGAGGAGRIPGEALAKLPKGQSYRPYFSTTTTPSTIVTGAKYRLSVGANRVLMGGTIAVKTAS